MKPVYTTIPVSLCSYAILHSKANHLKLLVYLKYIASGHIKYDSSLYKSWATDIGLSERWVRDAVKWMIKKKWITVNNKRGSLRIASYLIICRRLDINSNLAVRYENDDFHKFKEFCCSVLLTYQVKRKNWMDRKRYSVSKMGDTRTRYNSNPKGYSQLPVRYLAKCLGICESRANNIKRFAKESGLIKVKRQVIIETDVDGNKISKENLIVYENALSSYGKMRVGSKYLKIVEPDLIKSLIGFKRKRFRHLEKI